MKLLLDENLPHDLRHVLIGHDVFTVKFMGWSSIGNGDLLKLAAAAGFHALITKDVAMRYQQHEGDLLIAVVVIRAKSNKMEDIAPLIPALLEVLGQPLGNRFVAVA